MIPSFPIPVLLLLDAIAVGLVAVATADPLAGAEDHRRVDRRQRAVVLGAAAVPLGAIVVYAIAKGTHAVPVARVAAAVAWLSMVFLFLAGLAGVVARALVALPAVWERRARAQEKPNPARRRLVLALPKTATALGAAVAAGGITTGQAAPALRRVTVPLPALDPALDGLTILHLSDLHLGASLGVADLEAALAAARGEAIDLVLITGDVVDDRPLLDEALPKMAALAPGRTFACLGNHEYLRRAGLFASAWSRHGVTLLRDAQVALPLRGKQVVLTGVDDPMELRTEPVKRTIAASLRGIAPRLSGDLQILLSHRPEGFLTQEGEDFDLILSGHTHGGQWGVFGRSLLDLVTGRAVHWGAYARRGAARTTALYTTSGFGDWFPFRVACPRELPLITLRRGPVAP